MWEKPQDNGGTIIRGYENRRIMEQQKHRQEQVYNIQKG